MDSLYVFLIRNDVWIYILCGLAALWYTSELLKARGHLQRALYGLERERGQRLLRRSLAILVVAIVIILLVTYVNIWVAPTLPPELLRPPTPTPDLLRTPFSSPTPLQDQAESTLDIAPTVTLPASGDQPPTLSPFVEGTSELIPTATPTISVPLGDCPQTTMITAPPQGVSVSGNVTFFGTVTGDGLTGYQLDANGPGTSGDWEILFENNTSEPIVNDILGQADFGSWTPGDYIVRLRSLGQSDAFLGQCAIQLSVAPTRS